MSAGSVGAGDSRMPSALLENLEAGDDLAQELDEEFHHERMDRAMAAGEGSGTSRSWEAFRLTALEGWSRARGRFPSPDQDRPGVPRQEPGHQPDPGSRFGGWEGIVLDALPLGLGNASI